MTAHAQVARNQASVKAHIMAVVEERVDVLLADVENASGRPLELAVRDLLCAVGRELLPVLLAMACWSATAPEGAQRRGARLRLDRDYWLTDRHSPTPTTS